MLNIQENKDFIMEEYVCMECEKWWLSTTRTSHVTCPFCGGHAEANGTFNIKDIQLNETRE